MFTKEIRISTIIYVPKICTKQKMGPCSTLINYNYLTSSINQFHSAPYLCDEWNNILIKFIFLFFIWKTWTPPSITHAASRPHPAPSSAPSITRGPCSCACQRPCGHIGRWASQRRDAQSASVYIITGDRGNNHHSTKYCCPVLLRIWDLNFPHIAMRSGNSLLRNYE